MLEDLRTIYGIFLKKRLVLATLHETAGWCVPGTWCIEGPYARHVAVSLPDELRDSIRGIRRRQTSREFVERVLPPWRTRLAARATSDDATPHCSIAYFSNGGNWKLFDLERRQIWTRPIKSRDVRVDYETLKRFSSYFRIPQWRAIIDKGREWRCDQFLSGPSLAHCTEQVRVAALRTLFGEFGAIARNDARCPSPGLTQSAMQTIVESAPSCIPALLVQQYAGPLMKLAEMLPLVPSHGDLSAQNVFVQDGSPWVIDWDTAGEDQPLLYDILYLITREAALGREDLLQAYAQGAFEREMGECAGIREQAGWPCHRMLILMHAYIIHFHRKHCEGHRDANADNVARLWEPLRGYFDGLL